MVNQIDFSSFDSGCMVPHLQASDQIRISANWALNAANWMQNGFKMVGHENPSSLMELKGFTAIVATQIQKKNKRASCFHGVHVSFFTPKCRNADRVLTATIKAQNYIFSFLFF